MSEIARIFGHMFSRKALSYRGGTMCIKYGVGFAFGWLWGHATGSIGMVSLMIGLEVIWYGIIEHLYGGKTR